MKRTRSEVNVSIENAAAQLVGSGGTDEVAFNAVVRGMWDPLTKVAQKILKTSESSAEDMVAPAFMQLLDAIREGRKIENANAFLTQIVKYKCLNELRSQLRKDKFCTGPVTSVAPVGFPNPEEGYRVAEILEAVGSLPERTRTVVEHAIREEGSTSQEAADALGINATTVRQRQVTARKKLASKL